MSSGASAGLEVRDAVHAAAGTGPLLQRECVGTLKSGSCSPESLAKLVREHFFVFGPPVSAVFKHEGGDGEPLGVGDELAIRIGNVMPRRVRVVRLDDLCLTLRTLGGHLEAGRISFKAGRDDQGRLDFHFRSRARPGGLIHDLGFLRMGPTMQVRGWIRSIARFAQAHGGERDGPVRVTTARRAA